MKIKIGSKKLFHFGFLIAGIFLFLNSCDDSKGECNRKISEAGDDDSHRAGENCILCHFSGGNAEGCFVVAGSVFDSTKTSAVNSGTIKLFTGPNGTGSIAATIQVDSRGNFYSTDALNFIGGLYPGYTSSAGKTNYMSTAIQTGNCNSCHNVSTDKIYSP